MCGLITLWLMKPSLIISIKEARKLLGKEAKEMSDDQIEELIINLRSIVRNHIRTVQIYHERRYQR